MKGAQKERHESPFRVQRRLDDFDEFLGEVSRSG